MHRSRDGYQVADERVVNLHAHLFHLAKQSVYPICVQVTRRVRLLQECERHFSVVSISFKIDDERVITSRKVSYCSGCRSRGKEYYRQQ